jgi:glycosyltransferase involved in cell wall biosynthesis
MSIEVSVILPVYNTEKYLQKCLESIIAAKKNIELEIILINDGSTDNSLVICNQYAVKYDFIKVINQKNSGVSIARNKGIKVAKGDFISFIDSDDWIEIDFFSNMLEEISKEKVDLVVTNIKNIKKDSIDKRNLFLIQKLYSDKLFEPTELFQNENFILTNSPFNKLYLRRILDSNKILFKEHLKNGEDFIFVLEYGLCCKKIHFINDYSYNYNKLSESSATSKYIKNYYYVLKSTKEEYFIIASKYQKINQSEKMYHYFRVASKAIFEEGKITNGKTFMQRYYSIKHILNIEEIKKFRRHYKLTENTESSFFKFLRRLMKANQSLLITIFLTIYFKLKS